MYYAFALPKELIDTLVPRTLLKPPSRVPSPLPIPLSIPLAPAGSKSCNVCLGSAFANVDDQRAHFKSDWHRYNVKLRLRGENAINEARFSSLIDGLEDSLSGSASSSDEERHDQSSDHVDAIQTLLDKLPRARERTSSPTEDRLQMPRNSIVWFHSPQSSTQIGTYRLLYPLNFPQIDYLPALKDMQQRRPTGRHWLMLMVAGGHFAGILVQIQPPKELDAEEEVSSNQKKNKHKLKKPDFEILKHKTFHRYTTRRKQGGSQSVNDDAKGFAKSAGASLRRYGEQALREDIRNLMEDWAEDIAACEMIWIRASVSNKRIFYDYDEAVFRRDDERLRNFPFPTRRPTYSELTRCLNELTKVKTSHFTEDELRAQDEAYLASLPKPKPKALPQPQPPVELPKPAAPHLTKEEAANYEKWDRLLEMVKKGRLEAFKDLWSREGAQLGGINYRTPNNEATLLHISASSGQQEITEYILEELHADPTIPIAGDSEYDDNEGLSDTSDAPLPLPVTSRRVAYDLSKTRAVRDVFRRCAALHPDWWDWLGAARIPSVLTQKMEEEKEERKRQRRKGLKDKIRERHARQTELRQFEEVVLEPAPTHTKVVTSLPPVSTTGPRRLGGTSGAQESVMGLSAEMRAKVERERRARAAELRLKGSTGGH